MKIHPLLIACSLSLTACGTLAPTYEQPHANIPAQWPEAASASTTNHHATTNPSTELTQQPISVESVHWKQLILDPRLQTVIEKTLTHNRDLQTSALNLERAYTLLSVQHADYFPALNATVQNTRQQTPSSISSTGKNILSSQYRGQLGFSGYELDFFGKIRSLNDAALNTWLASESAHHSAQLSLIAATASAWYTLSADSAKQKLAQETLNNQEESFKLIQRKFELGIGTELDVNQARSTVENARADLARYTRLATQDLHALNLLTGTTLDNALLPQGELEETQAPFQLAPGIPSETLLKRPDVQQAEYQLKAAYANIGAARAAFFPSISLTATYGSASPNLSDLFSAGTQAWNFIPSITLPIFNAGRLQANLKISEIDQQLAATQYQKTIENAFREVADALSAQTTLRTEQQARQALVQTNTNSYQLAQVRFEGGVDNYLQVLSAQQNLYNAQQNLIDIRLTHTNNLLTLYKVLGGNWQASTPTLFNSKVTP